MYPRYSRVSRAAEKKAADDAVEVEEEAEDDPPAPTSDVEAPTSDVEVNDNGGSDEEDEKPIKKSKKLSEKGKDKAKGKGKGKGKAKGGMQMPEEWPWEEAKKIFEKPDVLPADEVEVRGCFQFYQCTDTNIHFKA